MMLQIALDTSEAKFRELAISDDPAQEGFLGFSVVLDVLKKLLFRIKMRFGERSHEELKTSEMTMFWMSHKSTLGKLLDKNFLPIPSIPLPIPMGMQVDYLAMLKAVEGLIISTPISIPTHRLRDVIQAAHRLLEHDDPAARRVISSYYHDTSKILDTHVHDADNTIRLLLNPHNPQTVKLSTDLFADRAAVKACIDQSLTIEPLLRNALKTKSEWSTLITECSSLVDTLVTGKANHFGRDDLLYFGMSLTRAARYYEFHGMVLNLMLQVEHLFKESLVILLRKL